MNTETLIQILSREPIEHCPTPFRMRLAGSVLLAGLVSFLMMSLGLGIQADLAEKIATPEFWIKFFFALTLFLAGAMITFKVASPGKASSNYVLPVAAPVITVWAIAAWVGVEPSAPSLTEMIEGSTWRVCSILIASLSIPIFIAVFWSLRDMAPTRPRFAGFIAGLFSGGLAACIYCLHCPEFSPVFVGIWYLVGILIPAGVGAMLGKTFLTW